MYPRNNRRNRILEVGVLMLVSELLSVGYDAIPPVTLATIIGQALLYIGVIEVPWDKWDVCISGHKVLYKRDFRALVFSTFEHADDMHLYYNMISYLVKGRTLESRYGSANFALLLVIITILTSGIYVALAVTGSYLFMNSAVMKSCTIGFSGVIFALKFITTFENSEGYRFVGIQVPTQYATWVELIAIHVLVPNASFMGHLAGVLTGFLYIKTYVGRIIDAILYRITGHKMIHGPLRARANNSNEYRSSNYNHPRYNFFSGFFGQPTRGYRSHFD